MKTQIVMIIIQQHKMNVNYLEHHSAIVKTQSSQHAKTNVSLLVKELAPVMVTKSAATTTQTIA
jgi:hypothetical protein